MKAISLFFILVLFGVISYGQISIDNTTYTTTQLVDGVLIPAASGTTISNVQFGGVYNNSNRYQVGYFSTAGTTLASMGFSDGIVLSTGNTSNIPLTLGVDPGSVGQMATNYTSCTAGEIRESGTCGTFVNDLDILSGAERYYNAAILEFDFVPVSNSVQFRYVFGSEEYEDNSGFINYQCSNYNDKFGFLISGPGIVGVDGYDNSAVNIATLANGSEVGINSVNNGVVGSSGGAPSASNCQGANTAWVENVSTAEFLGPIDGTQLNGNTIALTASRTGLTPGQTYHIKLIVTDVNDGTYDAVVYLEAGSFTTEDPCTPPNEPTGSTTQPDCTTPTGTITITAPALAANEEYVVTGTAPVVASVNNTTGVFNGLAPGDYDVQVENILTGCISTALSVTVNTVPSAPTTPTATVSVQPDCETPTGTIEITAPVGTSIEYSIDGINYQSSTTFSGLAPGDYEVTTLDNVTGCISTFLLATVNNVPIPEPVVAGVDVFILASESTTLSASGNGTVLWSNNENTNSITVSPSADTEYCVTLTDINNCTSEACITVFIIDESEEECGDLFIPTAFSPNNDSNNDLYQLQINPACVQSMSMMIFDRWGELIIEMTDPNEMWDGTFKGKPLNTASFAYVLKIKLSNQEESQTFSGNINLIK